MATDSDNLQSMTDSITVSESGFRYDKQLSHKRFLVLGAVFTEIRKIP